MKDTKPLLITKRCGTNEPKEHFGVKKILQKVAHRRAWNLERSRQTPKFYFLAIDVFFCFPHGVYSMLNKSFALSLNVENDINNTYLKICAHTNELIKRWETKLNTINNYVHLVQNGGNSEQLRRRGYQPERESFWSLTSLRLMIIWQKCDLEETIGSACLSSIRVFHKLCRAIRKKKEL